MKGETRCVDGRLYRHDPQYDDPYLETDRGICPECDGEGCTRECDVCGAMVPELHTVFVYGIETSACDICLGRDEE